MYQVFVAYTDDRGWPEHRLRHVETLAEARALLATWRTTYGADVAAAGIALILPGE